MHYSDLDSINGRIFNRTEVSLGEAELREVEACYRFLEDFEQGKVIYGINTGFGPMAQYRIGDADLNSLQYNIIRSHSCGAGETLPDICVRAAMLARLQTFLNAKSGVHPDVVRILADFLNNEIYPLVPRHGSVGASGDLVQLAHIALALIGESEVSFRGETVSAAEAMKACGITPLRLRIRDGLALTNGTAVMTGIGMVNLAQARRLLDWAVKASVMLNEVVESYDDFMAEPLNACKLHAGQIEIARRMREICASSRRLRKRETELYSGDTGEAPTFKHKVQPYYSLRCTPQILGPVLETLEQAEKILVEEFNSVDDNPVVDPKTGTIYHGGNFHGEPMALPFDFLGIAASEIADASERRTERMVNPALSNGLTAFLTTQAGVNSGFMIVQYAAASMVSENKVYAHPASVDSIPSSANQEDIVSMGTTAARKAKMILQNTQDVLADELLTACQAIDIRRRLNTHGQGLTPLHEAIYQHVRKEVAFYEVDREIWPDIRAVEKMIRSGELLDIVKEYIPDFE